MLASVPPEEDPSAGLKERLYSGASISNEITCAEAARVMDAADRIVRYWPKSANSLFSSLADRNPNPCQRHPVHSMFATRSGYRLLGRIKSVDGAVIRVIDDALEDWLLHERGIYIDGRQRPKVGVEGDVAIDVADALRRLEGRTGHPLGISAWSGAGAVEMVGRKVSLASVEATVEAIGQLKYSAFRDGMSVEDWSTRFLYSENYRRSDAIRDVLSGRIRVQRTPGENRLGLASILVCREDFIRCTREATVSAKMEKRAPERRAQRAREKDGFYRSGRIHELLSELWPGRQIPDVTTQARVRCQTKVRSYYGREVKQRLYSIADAINLMEAGHP